MKSLGSGRTQYVVAAVVNTGSGPALMMVVVSVCYLSFPASGFCSFGPSHVLVKVGNGV